MKLVHSHTQSLDWNEQSFFGLEIRILLFQLLHKTEVYVRERERESE